jgi:hypothetical protein
VRNVVVLSVSLVVALTAAYMTWTREETEVSDEAVAIYDAREADVSRVVYRSEKADVTIERRSDARGEYFWVESTERKTKPRKPKSDPHDEPADESAKGEKAKGEKAKGEKAEAEPPAVEAPAEPPAAEPPAAEPPAAEPDVVEVETLAFLASDAAVELWKSVAPLQAMRELAAPADPATFGLAAPSATLEVARSSGAVSLEIGGETYGAKDRYVRYDGQVFLVDDAKLKPLEAAGSRLMERGLFPLQQKEIAGIEVALPSGEAVTWRQVNRDDAAKVAWARKETPDVADDVGATWINKLLGLKLQSYVPKAEDPGSLQPVFAYAIRGDDAEWRVEILRTTAEPPQFFAKSDFNRSLVKLPESMTRNVVDDLDALGQAAAPTP